MHKDFIKIKMNLYKQSRKQDIFFLHINDIFMVDLIFTNELNFKDHLNQQVQEKMLM